MGWQRRGNGCYYVHSTWMGGRTVTRYIGGGPAGELAAHLDALARERRKARAESLRAEADRREAPEAANRVLNATCALIVDAAMLCAGLHRHNYGPWRRRRRARPPS
jgi:hypothetical protein